MFDSREILKESKKNFIKANASVLDEEIVTETLNTTETIHNERSKEEYQIHIEESDSFTDKL